MSTYMPDLGVEERELEILEDRGRERVREPLVYERHDTTRSAYMDLALAGTDLRGAAPAGERLERHRRQMEAIPPETRVLPGTQFEHRVNPNTTAGTGGEFAPPLWLNQYFATAARPGEVIQRLVREKGNEFDLPMGVSSVNLPRLTKGTLVNDDTPGTAVDNQDVETEKVKAQAIVYAGQSDWSIQSLEQSPQGAHLDMVVFRDLSESLDASLEEDFISGRGESFEEALGLLFIPKINTVEYSTLEAKTFFTEVGKLKAKVGIERKRPPDAWLISTARLAWMAMTEDKEQQRPLILTDNVGDEWPEASLAGTAVYPNDAITRTYRVKSSEEANQEPLFCVRADDFLLWHSTPKTRAIVEQLSGTLQVRFELFRSTATMLHRYPSGISALVGAGMKPATGF